MENCLLGELSLGELSLGELSLRELSPWTINPCTTVATPMAVLTFWYRELIGLEVMEVVEVVTGVPTYSAQGTNLP